jgi:signal transduction histidine kinase
VPLAVRGETFGVMGALGSESDGRPFDEEAEAVMQSIAASAATAVATAKSVAEERLRDSIAAAEEARARWARELHDETLQGLGGLRMILSSALRSGSPEALRSAAEQGLEQTKLEIQGLRRLIAELRPAALDELGLGPAIETLAERTAPNAGFDVATRIELDGANGGRLPTEAENAVYRVVQEALTNVEKHAAAEHVRVEVRSWDGNVQVVVADDGRGFELDGMREGFGLVGMRERVELVGGALEIASSSHGSTSIRATIPVARTP